MSKLSLVMRCCGYRIQRSGGGSGRGSGSSGSSGTASVVIPGVYVPAGGSGQIFTSCFFFLFLFHFCVALRCFILFLFFVSFLFRSVFSSVCFVLFCFVLFPPALFCAVFVWLGCVLCVYCFLFCF